MTNYEPWNSESDDEYYKWRNSPVPSSDGDGTGDQPYELTLHASQPVSKKDIARQKEDSRNRLRSATAERSTREWLANNPSPRSYVDWRMAEQAQAIYSDLRSGKGDPKTLIPILTEILHRNEEAKNAKNEEYVLRGNPYQPAIEKYFELVRDHQLHGGGMVEITPAMQKAFDAEKGSHSRSTHGQHRGHQEYTTATDNIPYQSVSEIPLSSAEGYFSGTSGCMLTLGKIIISILMMGGFLGCGWVFIQILIRFGK